MSRKTVANTLSLNMRILREKNKLNQENAAKSAGISYSSWQKIEEGITSPQLSTIEKIARAFDTTVVKMLSE